MLSQPSMIDQMSESEVRSACKELSIDCERKRKRIAELEAKLDAAKDIARSAYVGEGGSISAFEYAWKVALGEARKDEGTLESHIAMKNAGLL